MTTIPDALYLEQEITTERFYNFDQTFVPEAMMDASIVDGELLVTWPYIQGAEAYELEWTWVNGYTGESTGGVAEVAAATALTYDFKYNATRVRLEGQNYYSIPLIYGDGYIAFRYRGVGMGGTTFEIPLEGTWSSAGTTEGESGILSSYPNYVAINAHEGNDFNYGAGMSFIENGVRSVGVTYMDGVLKPRQSQAQLNSQDKIIVGSTIYDHYGRPAIGVMSAPVDQSTLGYVDDLNMYDATTPYSKDHFDLDASTLVPMDETNSNGAANYYSDQNADNTGANGYLPDADGYPFVQVQYSPDPTGRIKKVGGLGEDLQLEDTDGGANEAHYTEYVYTTLWLTPM